MTPDEPRHPTLVLVWKIVSISFGGALILLGIVGLFLSILQGWLLILAGLAVLSPYSRKAKWVLTWLKTKLRIGHRGGHKGGRKGQAQPGPDGSDASPQEATPQDRRALM